MKIHHNYLYILDKIRDLGKNKTIRVLDYGCGKGLLVELARSEGIEIYGVEMFGPGSGVNIKRKALNYGGGGIIKEIVDEKIPFPDNFFDLVVSNQVFEHIPDLPPVISEIHRVLNPKGAFLAIFPSKDAIREGHCEVPFVHWMTPRSKFQYLWLRLFKTLGFGRRKKEKNPDIWANYFSNWLAENTFYKSYKVIAKQFMEHFTSIQNLEHDYIRFRLTSIGMVGAAQATQLPMIRQVSSWFCISFGSHVIICSNSK